MAEQVPVNFAIPGENLIASYNFFDVAEGSGIVEFCGCKVATGSASYNYILTTNKTMYSVFVGDTGGYSTLNGFSGVFEVVFNLPKTIKGTATLCVPICCYAQTGTRTGYITADIRKYDGSSETTIGASTQSPSITGINSFIPGMTNIKFSIARTNFKKGDTLRLYIAGTASGGSGSTADAIGHSPIGSQETATGDFFVGMTSRLSLFIPFMIDL